MELHTFKKFRELIYDKSGISLSEDKIALVSARIGKRMRILKMGSEEAYLKYLMSSSSEDEIVHFLDAISTNVTHFFRESDHFDTLAEFLRARYEAGQRRFRIWSAACSTGEEPYSIAMTLLETLEGNPHDTRILATDISTKVLAVAKEGIYRASGIQTVPPLYRSKYFVPLKSEDHGEHQVLVKDSLKKLISFNRLNLSSAPYPMSGPFDCIFCRNVMIYFDNTVRMTLLDEFYRLLAPQGLLIVSHTENLVSIPHKLQTHSISVYMKAAEAAKR